ncbi:hypothetical protein CAP35_01725 [Chitinophagaceae bacterium IBVUCB1]|nr:hypothetical protein CAP35_01725 [Chitinophagaceae bacterium IBVUCB1]
MHLCNEITQINDSLNYMGKVWGDEFKIAVNTKDFSHLPPYRKQVEDFIRHKTEHVKSMKDVGGSEKFRAAMLDILKYESDSIVTKMMVFESFTGDTPDEVIQLAVNNLFACTKEDLAKHDIMFRHLDEYADKNDFPRPIE